MKVNIFKKLIREVVREELDYKFSALEKKLDEVLVSSSSNSIVEDRAPQPTASPSPKVPAPAAVKPNPAAPMTKDSTLNDILAETAHSGEWKNIEKEAEVQSVTDNTQGLPDFLSNAINKDYSQVMKKIEDIVRQEQNKIGAQEILMPTIQSSEIWKESGRYDDYGEEMLRITDRQNREMLYGPTNEEQVTEIFRSSIKSYKSLPQLMYHIQWKFRDEIRPRFGIMRGREFYMKDAYSFDVSDEEAFYSYNKFFLSYLRTFKRLSLTAIPMAADTGPIGGNLSHEFIILADTGESKIFTDKRIFELDSDDTEIEKVSLESMRKKYEQFYAVTDEKFNKEEFEKIVSKENQLITKGIEVGHIFYFGDKYSKPMGASVDLPGGKKDFVKMGSYGIGVSRLVGAIIEAKYDDKNEIMKWPLSVAPYDIALIPKGNQE